MTRLIETHMDIVQRLIEAVRDGLGKVSFLEHLYEELERLQEGKYNTHDQLVAALTIRSCFVVAIAQVDALASWTQKHWDLLNEYLNSLLAINTWYDWLASAVVQEPIERRN